jgi:DNA processing protein
MGPVSFRKLRDHFGSVKKILKASALELGKVKGLAKIDLSEIKDPGLLKKAQNEIKKAARHRVQIIPFFDEKYPPALREIYDPPIALYVKGCLPDSSLPAAAVVGSRVASLYGTRIARAIALDLARAGVVVVSGLALGIDSAAHQGTLQAEGVTVAVLGGGLGQIYPPENQKMADRICQKGALVSEYPTDMKPQPGFFPVRNRIISGLSRAVVVVEAYEKSGALITADCALEQGRDVFAVPGNADSHGSKGTNNLLKQGAKLVTCAADILEELKVVLDKPKPQARAVENLSPQENKLLSLLQNDNLDVETLIEESGLEARQVISSLSLMEIKGLVKALPGKNYGRL